MTMKGDRQINIGGAPVVFAIGVLDGEQLEVYRYIVVTQDLDSGICAVGTVAELVTADEMEGGSKTFRVTGSLPLSRQEAISHALGLAGYPPLAGEED